MMNPGENISPEEKLLRLIRKSGKQPQRGATEKEASSKNIKPKARNANLRFQSLNRFLLYLFYLLLLVFILSFFFADLVFRKAKVQDNSKQSKGISTEDFKKVPYRDYSESILNKELFGKAIKTAEKKSAQVDIQSIIKDLVLIGILTEEEPKAIIEDKRSKKTYFLKQGGNLRNMRLVEILVDEGKIVLEYQGENFDLYL